ncbi:MAG TPA: squalene--hopene cyclase [Acidimicrobiales bacterium]|nr:squalene--hopene cyclase [Acidimicrobiales bacterium]
MAISTDAPARPGAPQDAADALERSRAHLLSLQHPDGWWKGLLETNVTMDAEDLMLRRFLGVEKADDTAATAAWIRSHQRDDGTWATFYGGPGDLSTTIEAYVGLRLAGDPTDAAHMRAAAEFVRDSGGLEASRVFTRIWMALFGQWPWAALPSMPPEVVLLPPWVPLNVYDFACWARQTIVALTVVGHYRPVRDLGFAITELTVGSPPRPRHSLLTTAGRFEALDRVLHLYERIPANPLRRAALAAAESWILRRQEADGGWGGIQPPWVYSLLALHLRGYPLDHPAMRAGLDGLEGFTVRQDGMRWLEACQSPVWDTALAVTALASAGVPAEHPSMQAAGQWLAAEEITVKGDWAVRRPDVAPGGWAFEFANDNYPDTDDTAEVVLALRASVAPPGGDGPAQGAVARAVAWLEAMESKHGGWGAFDADNVRALCRDLPFCDFGEVIDPPSADVTAHVVEMLADEATADPAALRRGVQWLWSAQEDDGSWFGRWGANHVYGTGAVVPALIAAGADPADLRIRRAVRWLHEHQNPDGGWGEDLRSYADPAWKGRGASTASQTAWALLALLAAGDRGPEAAAGVEFLVHTQGPEGTWDEPYFTGTGFPGDFYINYHLYRLVFPVMALGRWVHGTGPGRPRHGASA